MSPQEFSFQPFGVDTRPGDLRRNVTKTFTFSFLISWRTPRRIKLSVTKLFVIQQTEIYRSNNLSTPGLKGNPREENVCTELVVFLGTAIKGYELNRISRKKLI